MDAKIAKKQSINCSISQNPKLNGRVCDNEQINANTECPEKISGGATQRGPAGPQGEPGNGVVGVEPISQTGYDTTYRMTFTDGSYFDFIVSNGTGSLQWLEIKQSDWQSVDGKYQYTYNGSYGVIAVYEGTVSDKNKVECDFEIISGVTYITSLNAFDGFALVATVEDAPSTYVYDQAIAADTWVITHNLDTYPSVEIVDSADTRIGANEVVWNDSNTITITFLAAVSGKAYLNYTR